MPSGYGFGGHIGFAKETTWGTGVAATDYVEALNESLCVRSRDSSSSDNHKRRYSLSNHRNCLLKKGSPMINESQLEQESKRPNGNQENWSPGFGHWSFANRDFGRQ